MTVKITKPSINVREKLSELDKETGIKGEELLRADTSAEAREALQLDEQLFTDFESTGIDDNATSTAVTIDSSGNVGIGTSSPIQFSSVQAGLTLSGISGSFPTRAGALSFVSQDTTSTECHIHARDAYMAFETGTSATSAERMRITSSGNVGIGTSSPLSRFVVSNGSDENIEFIGGSATYNGGVLQYIHRDTESTRPDMNYFLALGGGGSHKFYTSSAERMRIDSSGNLGIGVTTVSEKLQVDGNIRIGDTATGTNDNEEYSITSGGQLVISANDSAADISYSALVLNAGKAGGAAASSSVVVIQTNNAEAMRIDSSGNLLVGKTSTSSTTAGTHLNPNGKITTTRSGGPSAAFVRLTSDGSIVDFQKDSTTVGSIFSHSSGNIGIGTGDTGVLFAATTETLQPWNTSTNSVRDAAIDLGINGGRFKDLYLSSGLRADTLTFKSIAGTERMRIDTSGRVGIGTADGDAKLSVVGGVTQNGGESNLIVASSNPASIPATITQYSSNSTLQVFAGGMGALSARGGQIDFIAGAASSNAGTLLFRTGTSAGGTSQTERMRIDSSGRVGIGVVPSAWGSTYKVLQVGGGASLYGRADGTANQSFLGTNIYYNGTNDIFIGTGYATRYFQNNGIHRWDTSSASGTAGNPITFTQAMTLDASGNLLVGTTTAGTKSGDAVIAFGSAGGIIEKTATVAASGTVDIAVNTSGGGYQGFMIVSNTVSVSANNRTHRTYSVFGRGTDSSIQQIAADNGVNGGAAFTVTTPTNGVIRVTNTSAFTCIVVIQFFGGTSV